MQKFKTNYIAVIPEEKVLCDDGTSLRSDIHQLEWISKRDDDVSVITSHSSNTLQDT